MYGRLIDQAGIFVKKISAVQENSFLPLEAVSIMTSFFLAQNGTSALSPVVEEPAQAAAAIGQAAAPAFTWGGYFQAIGYMILLLLLLWGVLWAIRRYGKFNCLPLPGAFPKDGLRMEAQLAFGPRRGLMVVRYLNRRLLLGVTDHQITLLKDTALEQRENEDEPDRKRPEESSSFERFLAASSREAGKNEASQGGGAGERDNNTGESNERSA